MLFVQLEVSYIALQMLRKSKRVSFSPDVNEKTTMFLKNGVLGNRKRVIGSWSFSRLPKDPLLSPVRFLLRLGAKVASSIRVVTMGRRSSRKVSSSTLVRSHSLSDPNDSSYRAKAVEDCIEFLHSSSSRERPSWVSLYKSWSVKSFQGCYMQHMCHVCIFKKDMICFLDFNPFVITLAMEFE